MRWLLPRRMRPGLLKHPQQRWQPGRGVGALAPKGSGGLSRLRNGAGPRGARHAKPRHRSSKALRVSHRFGRGDTRGRVAPFCPPAVGSKSHQVQVCAGDGWFTASRRFGLGVTRVRGRICGQVSAASFGGPGRVSKSHREREMDGKNPNIFEGRLPQTAILQQLARCV